MYKWASCPLIPSIDFAHFNATGIPHKLSPRSLGHWLHPSSDAFDVWLALWWSSRTTGLASIESVEWGREFSLHSCLISLPQKPRLSNVGISNCYSAKSTYRGELTPLECGIPSPPAHLSEVKAYSLISASWPNPWGSAAVCSLSLDEWPNRASLSLTLWLLWPFLASSAYLSSCPSLTDNLKSFSRVCGAASVIKLLITCVCVSRDSPVCCSQPLQNSFPWAICQCLLCHWYSD